MNALHYTSGQEIKEGDHILYHGESGRVAFIAIHRTGDRARDWYVDQFPGGGLMVEAENFGSVFLNLSEIDEQLELVSRADSHLRD